jgi:ribosomal protein S18 acetylase RimI-like enzyme
MAEWRHEHLDWMEPADLLPQAPFLLALDHGRMAACLACPPDQEEVAWLRLFAVAPGYTPSNLWHGLWPKARQALEERGVRSIAVLTLAPWLPPLLEASGFRAQSAVIFLRWQGKPPQPVETEGLTIRTMRMEDLEKVTAVDRRAFDATWRYTTSILRAAFRKAHLASVAEHQGQIIGYQMTTASAFGAHLARLAVDPSWQARGIGSALVAHVLNHISRWGFTQLTVNTQEDNQASLRLYARMGFKRTQERFPIYQYAI